jgi:hypothetical protein
MFRSITIKSSFLSIIVIASIVLCKYFNLPKILLLVVLLASILFQIDSNKTTDKNYNFEEILINLSKFIILSVIFGCIITKILGLFLPDFA